MKFKDVFNMYENKSNNQIKLELKKRIFKETNLTIKEIMDLNLPERKK